VDLHNHFCWPDKSSHLWYHKPGVVKAVEEFKLSVYGENYAEESDMGTGKASDASKKQKKAAENGAKESTNYNWPDLADNGQVCFLVFQTRWCLS